MSTDVLIVLDSAARTAISVVFAMSVFWKLSSASGRQDFRRALVQMAPWLPPAPAAAAVLVAEVAVPILLVAEHRLGYLLASVLLVAYVAAMVRLVRTGRRVSCGCLGSSSAPVGPRQIARNVVLLGICVLGALAAAFEGVTPAALATALGAVLGLAMALGVIAAERYTAVFDKPLEGM